MKTIKNLVLTIVAFLGIEKVTVAGQGLADKLKQADKTVSRSVSGAPVKKAAEVKQARKLSPTTSKARVFYSDETKEVEGVEVIVCQGKCTSRTSVPYEKDMKEIQAKAEKMANAALAAEGKNQ